MEHRLKVTGVAIVAACAIFAPADVLYKGQKAIALGKGVRDKNVIHWTYCDGKKGDFSKPPHDFVTGEHCKIQPDVFGVREEDGKYFVADPAAFSKFFPGAAKGDKVMFSVSKSSVRMDYKGQGVTLYRSADHKKDTTINDESMDHPR